jgi:hypothetical protein
MLVAALFLSAFFGVYPDPDEASAPLATEQSHEGDLLHSHAEHPEGIVDSSLPFAGSGHAGGPSLVDGYKFSVRSRHGLPLERPPEAASPLS